MAVWSRDRRITNVLVVVAALLLFYVTVLQSYLDKRDELATERDVKMHAVADAQNTINRRNDLQLYLRGPGAALKTESAAVQTQFLHMVHDWESQLNLRDTSFQRVITAQDHGFTRVTFQVSGIGAIGSVAGLLYRIETSPMPLRLESAEVRPSGDGDDLQVRVNVAALCLGVGPKAGITAAPTHEEYEIGGQRP